MNTSSVINAQRIAPSVSIIIPTRNEFPAYEENERKLKGLLKQVRQELLDEYPEEKANNVLEKLYQLVDTIDHQQLSQGLAIFASPTKEKVVYLPFPVEEKVIIDSSFEIRDLLYASKNSISYLVLLLGHEHPKVYFGYNSNLVEAPANAISSAIKSVKRDYPSQVSNFTDSSKIKEVALDNYLREVDAALTAELNRKLIPVFICGVDRTVGHFKKLTNNDSRIVAYIEGNFDRRPKEEVFEAIEPHLKTSLQGAQESVINKVREAIDRDEYSCGITNVWRAVSEGRGSLLVVEKDYRQAGKVGLDERVLETANLDRNDYGVLRDAVDDVMERVLKNGGDIAFVDNGALSDYQQIVLITYY